MTMKLSPTQIKEIAERAEKATKGPWAVHDHGTMARKFGDKSEEWLGYAWVGYDGDSNGLFQGKVACLDRRRDGSEPFREAASTDANFIAAARQDIPNLLAHIAAQDGERKEINSLLMRELTPSGSEFHDDPRACIEFAKRRMNSFSMSKLAELKAQIAKLERERDEAKKLSDGYAEAVKFAEIRHHDDTLQMNALHQVCEEQNYWAWQGDGKDGLDTLSCPIVIRPEQLREIFARIAQLESQIAMKDGALKVIANGEIVLPGGTPVEIAREALKGSA